MYILCFAPRCLKGSLIPYKNEEHQICGLSLRRELCAGWVSWADQMSGQQPLSVMYLVYTFFTEMAHWADSVSKSLGPSGICVCVQHWMHFFSSSFSSVGQTFWELWLRSPPQSPKNKTWDFCYWCYYPHRLRYSISPICGIFMKQKFMRLSESLMLP